LQYTVAPRSKKNSEMGYFLFFCKKNKKYPPNLLPLTPFREAKTVGRITGDYFKLATYNEFR